MSIAYEISGELSKNKRPSRISETVPPSRTAPSRPSESVLYAASRYDWNLKSTTMSYQKRENGVKIDWKWYDIGLNEN